MSKIDKFIKEQTVFMFSTTLRSFILALAKAADQDIKELKESLIQHSNDNFTDLEKLQEEFSTSQIKPLKEGKTKSDGKLKLKGSKGIPPPAGQYIPVREIREEEDKVKSSLAILLQKAKQMEKEQQFSTNHAISYHQDYREGILAGINRIVRLIERYYKS